MVITSNSSAAQLLSRSKSLADELKRYRRHIHKHPELSFAEAETARFIVENLKAMGLESRAGVGGTGVICDIGTRGADQSEIVALRADMDALPIQELNSASYASQNDGVMHACGHDAHVACLLGAARLLAETPPARGIVRLMFQPAEEDTNADGLSGASLMMRDGALNGVKSVVALHVNPKMESGHVGLRAGPLLAACDKFEIKVQGKGSHGAWPHLGIDAVVIAAQVVQAIQTIVSRRVSALEPVVVTIGGIRSSTYRPNIVADSVELTGTARYFNKENHEAVRREVENACKIAELMGGAYELRYINENPALVNDAALVSVVESVAKEMLGEPAVEVKELEMGAEDFSFISDAHPSCFIFLGTRTGEEQTMLHTANFDLDERALPVGAALLAASALAALERQYS